MLAACPDAAAHAVWRITHEISFERTPATPAGCHRRQHNCRHRDPGGNGRVRRPANNAALSRQLPEFRTAPDAAIARRRRHHAQDQAGESRTIPARAARVRSQCLADVLAVNWPTNNQGRPALRITDTNSARRAGRCGTTAARFSRSTARRRRLAANRPPRLPCPDRNLSNPVSKGLTAFSLSAAEAANTRATRFLGVISAVGELNVANIGDDIHRPSPDR